MLRLSLCVPKSPVRFRRLWSVLLAGACTCACVPEGGRILSLVASDTATTNAASSTSTSTSTQPGQGDGSGTVSTAVPVGSAFAALTPQAATLRVKNLLTGLVPTAAEYEAVSQDPASLDALVDAWLTSPEYKSKMQVFWGDAFQQSQAQAEDFHLSLDDMWFTPVDALLLNFRQSFARTVQALVESNASFTEVATTQSYMMTTAMMMYLAYSDTALEGDSPQAGVSGVRQNRFLLQNADWNYTLLRQSGMVPLTDSANPNSTNYLKFYIPTVGSSNWRTPGSTNQGNAAYCAQFDPIVMTQNASFEYGQGLTKWLYAALKGDEYRFFNPVQGAANAMWCAASPSPSIVTDADHADWRMVTIQTPTSPAAQSKFYDVAGLRTATTLSIYAPRVGYFTTPSFFSQWNTNISNQARSVANQTLITGLGSAFDGKLAVQLSNPPGLNSVHAANPVCLSCHINLDPMRQFFRQNYSLSFSAQLDSNQQVMNGTFGFDGVSGASSSMADLGRMIGTHPRFKLAWAQKLCNWANSTVCDLQDPELIRISALFAANNYNWQTLVKAMFTSPLVTYLATTQTAQNLGVTAPIARRSHLCAALDARLGLADSCGLMTLQDGLSGTAYTNLAYNVPKDAYSRGAVDPIYVTEPDLFYRNVVENICSLAADMVVDQSGPVTFTSSAPAAAADDITRKLLGLDSGRDTAVSAVLLAHYTDAAQSGITATQALKSTFVLACSSPYMVSIGQ